MAKADSCITAAALVGSSAEGGDSWSDLDLTFAVATEAEVPDILSVWTGRVAREFSAVRLFDLPVGSTVHRVFLLPGNLQLDLSFAPESEFRPLGPRFTLIFGNARPARAGLPTQRSEEEEHFGRAAPPRPHQNLHRAREALAGGILDHLGSQRGAIYGMRPAGPPGELRRGLDDLPKDLKQTFVGLLATKPEPQTLLYSLARVIESLLRESGEREQARRLESQLRQLGAADQ